MKTSTKRAIIHYGLIYLGFVYLFPSNMGFFYLLISGLVLSFITLMISFIVYPITKEEIKK